MYKHCRAVCRKCSVGTCAWVGPGAPCHRVLCSGLAREPWELGGWLVDVRCSQHPGPQRGWGSTLRAPPSDATSLKLEPREILLSFFFFFELELSVISTQSQGRGPLRKINLCVFLLASLWLWLPGYLHDSFPPVLSLFPKTPELSPVSRWGFDRSHPV